MRCILLDPLPLKLYPSQVIAEWTQKRQTSGSGFSVKRRIAAAEQTTRPLSCLVEEGNFNGDQAESAKEIYIL